MHRFFLDTDTLWQEVLQLQDSQLLHQFTKVLRLGKWEKVIFFDGKNFVDFVYILTQIEKKQMLFSLTDSIPKIQNRHSFHLFQALPNKISTLEEIVFFGTQVWYTSFSFFPSQHSQPFFISDAKKERLRKILIESCEQSGRNYIPSFSFLSKIPQPIGHNICFHTDTAGNISLETIEYSSEKTTNIFIGPEWWWSESEMKDFQKNGFQITKLQGNVLRIVTAVTGIGFYFSQKI